MPEPLPNDGYLPQKRFYSFLLARRIKPLPLPEERKPFPFYKANLISQIFFLWIQPVMVTGYGRTLQPEDLWYLGEELQVETLYLDFDRHLSRRVAKSVEEHQQKVQLLKEKHLYDSDEDEGPLYPKHCIVGALWDTFKWEYSCGIALVVTSYSITTLTPLVSRYLIRFVEEKSLYPATPVNRGVGYAIGTTLLVVLAGITNNHFINSCMLVGAKLKAVLTKLILEKSFVLNSTARHRFPTGRLTSLMSTDLSRIDMAIGFQPMIISFPIMVAISIVLLVINIGVSSLVAIAIFIIAVLLMVQATKRLFAIRKTIVKYTDARIGTMKELMSNMKIIKYYSWESSYLARITNLRNKEMHYTLKMQLFRGLVSSFAISLPQVSSMVAFLVLYALKGSHNPADIFSSLSLFTALAQQALILPMILASGSDALVAFERVQQLLQCGEIDREATLTTLDDAKVLALDGVAIRLQQLSFKWKTFGLDDETMAEGKHVSAPVEVKTAGVVKESATIDSLETSNDSFTQNMKFPGLHDVDLDVFQREFMVITGPIGSGKSSLLQAMAGFMHREAGSMLVNGSLLLCGEPWIQNATIRENILFGLPFETDKYAQIVELCCLEADFEALPAGDATEIGERGITLSGGQKLRISLARAVYQDTDIVLLDDVLSAVDAKVGKDIVNKCITGLLKSKTRILATHQLSLIGSADRIVFLNGDGTVQVGTMEQLKGNAAFSELMQYSNSAEEEDVDDAEAVENVETSNVVAKIPESEPEAKPDGQVSGKLIQKEAKGVNSIKFDVYRKYVQLGSGPLRVFFPLLMLMIVILAAASQILTNNWLSFWVSRKFDRTLGFYMGIYVMLTFLTVIFIVLEVSIMVYAVNRASKYLNIIAVEKILRVPMSYVDVTPLGRILNRFSKDTDSLDNEIIEQLRIFIYQGANVIGIVIICIVYLPWFAIAVPFLVWLFVSLAHFYQASSREIKRLESVQRSIVYNNFNETLTGMATIQAYKRQKLFLERNSKLTDVMNELYFLTISNQRWLGVHLTIFSGLFTLLITLLSVTRQFKIGAASAGLLVSYVLQIANQVSMIIRTLTRVEVDMNSAERLYEYAYELPSEAAFEISDTKPRPTWPENGCISFQDVCLSYRPELPLVLKNVSLQVGAHQKIGICGRTGAGKSSIMSALYRLTELTSGSISIDGIDISTLGLHDLRSKLSIIPQDPVLFKGTVRSNLDPFGSYSDEDLWNALKRSGLIEASSIEEVQLGDASLHKFHLDQLVDDEGINYSLGERQLIALARAVVRNSKILVLDEATSSVDYETDFKIQTSIAREFANSTILCIAHRLNTIINYDKILVLDQGQVAEFDAPLNLYELGGIFTQMCEKSGITEADFHRE